MLRNPQPLVKSSELFITFPFNNILIVRPKFQANMKHFTTTHKYYINTEAIH